MTENLNTGYFPPCDRKTAGGSKIWYKSLKIAYYTGVCVSLGVEDESKKGRYGCKQQDIHADNRRWGGVT